jgi:hypothetical protein
MKGEEVIQGFIAWASVHMRKLGNGIDLRGEIDTLRRLGVDQRLLAKSISGQKNHLSVHVIKGKGKHSPQVVHAPFAEGFPEVDDDLRV